MSCSRARTADLERLKTLACGADSSSGVALLVSAYNPRMGQGRYVARIGWVGALALLGACASSGGRDYSGMSFSDTPLEGKVIWNDLVTEDGAAARRFYGSLFGWTYEQTVSAGGRPYSLARAGGIYVAGIVEAPRPAGGLSITRWVPYFSVADVDASVARASALGGRAEIAPRNVPLGRIAVVTDTEQAVIGLVRSRIGDPDDATTRAAPGRVVWHELPSNDPSQAANFMREVTALVPRDIARRGGTYTMLASGGIERAGILKNPGANWQPQWLTHFGVEDPAAAAQRAVQLGGKLLLAPSPELREGTVAVITDPGGAILVLHKLGAPT